MPPKFKKNNTKIADRRLRYLLLNGDVKLADVRIGKRKGLQKVIAVGTRHFT
jgi:hypothetical protein